MGVRSTLFLEYISLFLSKYYRLHQQAIKQDIFRLIEIIHTNTNGYKLKIQIVGKSIVFNSTPLEIISNNQLLEGFPKRDIRAITYLATKELRNPKYRIIAQDHQDQSGNVVLKVMNKDKKEIISKSAQQISLDKNLLHHFSPEEAHFIGYTTATEQIIKENDEKEKLKTKYISN